MKRTVFKDFDVEKAKRGAKVQTKNGYDVHIIAYDIEDKNFPILAIVTANLEDDIEKIPLLYTEEGIPKEEGDDYSLQIVEEEEEIEIESEDEMILNNIQECLQLFFKRCKYDKERISKEEIFKWIKKKKDELSRGECIEMWIARDDTMIDDEINDLFLYGQKPYKHDTYFTTNKAYDGSIILNKFRRDLFPEINFQNSPKKLKVNLLISDEDEENN